MADTGTGAQGSASPGPWWIGDINMNPEDGVIGEIAILAKDARVPSGISCPAVALPYGDTSEGRAIALANAALIAAAPATLAAAREMLRALKKLRMRFHACCVVAGNTGEMADLACKATDDVIAAAERAGIP